MGFGGGVLWIGLVLVRPTDAQSDWDPGNLGIRSKPLAVWQSASSFFFARRLCFYRRVLVSMFSSVMNICSFGKLSKIVFKVSWVNPLPQQTVMTPCNHFPFFVLLVRSGVSESLLSCGEQVRTCSHDFWLKNVSHYAYLLWPDLLKLAAHYPLLHLFSFIVFMCQMSEERHSSGKLHTHAIYDIIEVKYQLAVTTITLLLVWNLLVKKYLIVESAGSSGTGAVFLGGYMTKSRCDRKDDGHFSSYKFSISFLISRQRHNLPAHCCCLAL